MKCVILGSLGRLRLGSAVEQKHCKFQSSPQSLKSPSLNWIFMNLKSTVLSVFILLSERVARLPLPWPENLLGAFLVELHIKVQACCKTWEVEDV